jgi:hypothetical protein
MPIVIEYEGDLVHHYSNSGFKIRNTTTGGVYDDAWDLTSNNYEYEETEEKIDQDEEEQQQSELEEYAEAGRILLGEEGNE